MKKLLILTNLISLIVAIYFGYLHFYCKPPCPPGSTSCVPCKDFKGTHVEDIPADFAIRMVQNYRDTTVDLFETDSVRVDARSVWFSLDSMKRFIWHIENELCDDSTLDKSSLGLRFYYGRYPSFEEWKTYDTDSAHFAKMEEYQNLHTIFVIPTYADSTGNIDFDPSMPIVNSSHEALYQEMAKGKIPPPAKMKMSAAPPPSPTGGGTPGGYFGLLPSLDSATTNGALIPPKIKNGTR